MENSEVDFLTQEVEILEERRQRKKPKITKEWEESDIFKLINLVEAEKCLWDASDKAYHNKQLRDQAWRNICDHFHQKYEAVDLTTKWTNLRIQYRSYAGRLKTKSGQGVVEVPKWKFYNAMCFVGRAEDKQTQQTTSNLVFSIEDENSTSKSSDMDVQITSNKKQPSFSTPSAASQLVETMREAVTVIKQRRESPLDANDNFDTYLASELKALNPQSVARVRRKVNKYFLECLEEESTKEYN